MTEVKAHNRYLRMSPRKVRLVVDLIRGMDAEAAVDQLRFLPKAAARPVRKVLESAIANAEHNEKLDRKDLVIKTATVDQGPTIKRWSPRAMGAANLIRKRTSHVTIVLTPKTGKVEKKETSDKEEKGSKKELAASAKAQDDSVNSDAATPESGTDIRGPEEEKQAPAKKVETEQK